MKAAFLAPFMAVVMVFAIASPAAAQTYYYQSYPVSYSQPYQHQSSVQAKMAEIVRLQAQLAQLQALLEARQNQSYTYSYTTPYFYQYQPTGQVLGAQYSSGRSDIDVETGFVRDVDDDEATFRGEVDLEGADYAFVWFEYGEDGDFPGKTTDKRRTTRDTSFSADVDDLDEEEMHFYRAVGQDPFGRIAYGTTRYFFSGDGSGSSRNDDDEPEVETEAADDIDEDSAELNGEVDMNDFKNGQVFFVYGEDESQIEDVERDFDSYSDVDEDGDDLQKVLVDSDLDDRDDYRRTVSGLDEDTEYFFQICVGYEDEDDDDVLECGGVEDFETDRDGGSRDDDEPEAKTDDAEEIEDDEAELHGDVDMNDFDNGLVFFVYGEDERQIEDVARDYDSYSDVDEDGDDLQKVLVDSDLDSFRSYWRRVTGLDDNTDHYFQICVEYEDEDDDDTLECGGVEHFETD